MNLIPLGEWITKLLIKFFPLWAVFMAGKNNEKTKQLEKDMEDAVKEARKWANRNALSTPERLRKLAESRGEDSP